jgi:hypothetical protein
MWTLRYKPTPESEWRPEIEKRSLDACKRKASGIFWRLGSWGVFEILDGLGNVHLVSKNNKSWRMRWASVDGKEAEK